MKSYAAHVADCRSLCPNRVGLSVAVLHSVGLVLAESVVASKAFPAFANSAMDGYAVRMADVPGRVQIVGEVFAGRVPTVPVTPGHGVRIMTGALIPKGTEAIVPVEHSREVDGYVEFAAATVPGRHIRHEGEELAPGDVVVEAGQVIGPAQLSALVANGVSSVRAWRRLRVALISTGDELVAASGSLGVGQLFDSNRPGIEAAIAIAGADVIHSSHVGDDAQALIERLDDLPECDLIVTTGGISMGTRDVVKAALAPFGIHFEPVAIQPGRPQALGRFRDAVAFVGLPGNPVAASISFEVFAREVLGRPRISALATLLKPISSSPLGRRQFLRGRLTDAGVQLIEGSGSNSIASLARADCLVVVEEDIEQIEAGASVRVLLL